MKLVGSLSWIAVIVSIVVTGCTMPVKMETAQSLLKDQAIVFGKVNVIVEDKHVTMSPSGLSSYLTIEFRQKGSATIREYKVDESGYFYWALAPGAYEILGTYGYSADVGFLESMVSLLQRVWIPFTVPPEVESVYLGDLTLFLSKNRPATQRLDDNYSDALKAFHEKYPSARTEPLKTVTRLDPPGPETYGRVTSICGGEWGIHCSFDTMGVTPSSPDGLEDVVVESTAPELRWEPSSRPDVTYDVAIYEAYESYWRKILLDVVTGKKRWRRGRLVAYAQGLTTPRFTPDVSLHPSTTYVRLRRGATVSTWSQVKNTLVHPGAFLAVAIEQWETWLNFTTPSQ